MSQNVVPEKYAVENESEEGAYTYNSFPPDEYEGRIFVFAVLGLGEHAHVQVGTAFWHGLEKWELPMSRRQLGSHGIAGNFTVSWRDWLQLRDMLEPRPDVRVAEVRRASLAQLTLQSVGALRRVVDE